MHRLASHKNIFKTRALMADKHYSAQGQQILETLQQHVEELRESSILSSKFQNTFCTVDLLNVFLKSGVFDQLYCVEKAKSLN